MTERGEGAPRNGATNVKVGVHEWRLQELETGVKDIKGTLEEINGKIDRLPCPAHDAEMKSIRLETKAAHDLLLSDAKTAKGTLEEAAATAIRVKTTREADLAEIVTVAAATARKILSDDAVTDREKIKAEALDRRGQHHWLVERGFQLLPLLAAAGGYLLAKGGS